MSGAPDLHLTLFAALSVISAPTAKPAERPGCSLSKEDQAWVDKSAAAWNYSSEHITGIGHGQSIQAVFFDANCVLTSGTAMNPNSNGG